MEILNIIRQIFSLLIIILWGIYFLREYFKRKESKIAIQKYMYKNKFSLPDILILLTLWWGILGFLYQFIHFLAIKLPFYPYFDASTWINDSMIIAWYFTCTVIIFIAILSRVDESLKNKFNCTREIRKIILRITWFLSALIGTLIIKQTTSNIQIGNNIYSIYYMNNKYIMYYSGDKINRNTIIIRDRESEIIKDALFLP